MNEAIDSNTSCLYRQMHEIGHPAMGVHPAGTGHSAAFDQHFDMGEKRPRS